MVPGDFKRTHLASVGSTNDCAKELVRKSAPGACGVVSADVQTAGRGRGDNPWHSQNSKGLWASLYFAGTDWKPFDAVMRASLSVADALSGRGLSSALKWPNDIIVGRKKICGILTEASGKNLVIGIGANLNQEAADFPEQIRGRATSLFLETGAGAEAGPFLTDLLSRFCSLEDAEENFRQYCARLGIIGMDMEINSEPVRVAGVARDGALLCAAGQDGPRKFYSGSLQWK